MMEKRIHKKSGNSVSLLGFGCMRFPKIYPDKEDILWEEAEKLIDTAYASGVNYFDTAWVYHNGESERFIGHALKKYPRESFFLADKFPGWEERAHTPEGARGIFEEQLQRCGVEYFDYYLLHSINTQHEFESWYLNSGVLDYLFSEKANGRIKNLGFSFHGNVPLMCYLAPIREWDFAQIQLNYHDWLVYDSKELYSILSEHNIQSIVMEPVRGGSLATLTPEACAILESYSPDKSIASWAIRFAASPENVLTVLSGMSTAEQVEDNVKTLSCFSPLDENERNQLDKALAKFLERDSIPCTTCRYCNVCPQEIDIPGNFMLYNEFSLAGKLPIGSDNFSDQNVLKKHTAAFISDYYSRISENKQAHRCTSCGVCVSHCPQNIPIPEQLRKISGFVKRTS